MKASFVALLAFAAASASAASFGHAEAGVAARHHNVAKAHHPAMYKKRDSSVKAARCAAKTSSLISVSAASTASVASQATVSTASVASVSAHSTASEASVASVSEHSTKSVASTSSVYHKTHTTAKPKATNSSDDDDDDSGSSGGSSGQTFSGDATFYEIGLNACGWTDHEPDMICAVAIDRAQDYPGYTGNSNKNPICNKKIQICYEGNCATVSVTDTCAGCAYNDIDLSKAAFKKLASLDAGRLHGATWHFL